MHATHYLGPADAPSRADIDTTRGPLLLEFGTDWCGHCRAARPAVEAALAAHPGLRHLRVEDGPGRALGRSFGVTLWPTLVLLLDGQEQARLVRPRDAAPIAQALQALHGTVPSLNALLARQLARMPDATAFIEVDPDSAAERRVTLRQFDDLVGRSAAWLQDRGVVAGDTVALWLVNRLDWLVLHFALARLGAAVMTVNTRYRGAEVAYLLERSQPRLLVLQLHFRKIDFAAVLQDVDPASAASLQQVVVVDAGAEGAAGAQALPAAVLGKPTLRFDLHSLPADRRVVVAADATTPDTRAILFTTSGTTSGPKLVVHTQRTVSSHVQRVAQAMGYTADGVVLLAALPFAGTFGYVSMLAALAAGKPSVVMHSFDAAEAARLLVVHQVTHCFGSDEMFEALLAHAPGLPGPAGQPAGPAYPALRVCGFAAFRAGAAGVAEACIRRGLPMAGLYGSSEVHALFAIQGAARPLAERLEGGGTPVNTGAELRVRDAQTGALLPVGTAGLLEIRSPSNFIGYLNNPEATAAAIDAEGWFSSGDIGCLRGDGSFVYLTRAGDAIRLGGYLTAPAEIEEVIKAQPGVAAAQVVAVDLDGKTRAVAFVMVQPGASPDAETVIAAVRGRLAAYKVPARLWWVAEFPVVNSANGTKVQRNRLREMALLRLAAENHGQAPAAD